MVLSTHGGEIAIGNHLTEEDLIKGINPMLVLIADLTQIDLSSFAIIAGRTEADFHGELTLMMERQITSFITTFVLDAATN